MSTENQGAAVAADANPTLQQPPTAGDNQQDQAEPKTDDTAASADGTTTTDEAAEPPKKKADGGFQRRINRLTADFRAAEARAEAAEARAVELERRQQTRVSADDHKAPRLEDFKSYEDYERADRLHVAERATREAETRFRQAEAERAARAEREAEVQRMKEARERFEKSADAIAEHYEDFAEVIDDMWRGRIPVIRRHEAVARYIIEDSERGPALAYHLGTNGADAERIGKLSPLAQVRELVKLEASLPRPNAPATKAPNPPRTIGGRGGSDAKDPEKMTIDEMRRATGTQRRVSY